MENHQKQKFYALIFVIALICIGEIIILFCQTFSIIKFITSITGGIAILYYLFLIRKVILEK